MSRPQVTGDEEHERIHDKVAAIDVAKDAGVVCTRTPHPSRPGARRSRIWTVKARMNTIRALGRQLHKDGIEIVTLESTSDYWRIWFFVLEAAGLAVQLDGAARSAAGRGFESCRARQPGQRCLGLLSWRAAPSGAGAVVEVGGEGGVAASFHLPAQRRVG